MPMNRQQHRELRAATEGVCDALVAILRTPAEGVTFGEAAEITRRVVKAMKAVADVERHAEDIAEEEAV